MFLWLRNKWSKLEQQQQQHQRRRRKPSVDSESFGSHLLASFTISLISLTTQLWRKLETKLAKKYTFIRAGRI